MFGFSAVSLAILRKEVFAVTGMLRNAIAVHGNDTFLCTVSCFPLPVAHIFKKKADLFCSKQRRKPSALSKQEQLGSSPWGEKYLQAPAKQKTLKE